MKTSQSLPHSCSCHVNGNYCGFCNALGCEHQKVRTSAIDWPAAAYIYLSWAYALSQARYRANRNGQKVFVYRGYLDGEPVWVVSWDPKKR